MAGSAVDVLGLSGMRNRLDAAVAVGAGQTAVDGLGEGGEVDVVAVGAGRSLRGRLGVLSVLGEGRGRQAGGPHQGTAHREVSETSRSSPEEGQHDRILTRIVVFTAPGS